MEKERKITAPEGCEIEKIELVDGVAVVAFKEKERKLPKSWEEFCEIGTSRGTFALDVHGNIFSTERPSGKLFPNLDKNVLPDRATAEAVLALCQLIQLRNCYNGEWVPDWNDENKKYIIQVQRKYVEIDECKRSLLSFLYFKSDELRNEFLRNFRDLIEKLKPLYGIKEGGQND